MKKKPTQSDLLVNTAFMVALSLELMLREIERRFNMESATFVKEKRQKFTRFLENTKRALYFAEELTQDIFDVDAKDKWKNIPVWQDESNELTRLILMYADRSADVDVVNKIFKFIREIEGEGIVDEELLNRFYLRK